MRVQGYFNLWPAIRREAQEIYTKPDRVLRFPATPEAIDRMEETLRWVLWPGEEQRHLVWMRAGERDRKEIARCFGCGRTTAWRRGQRVLGTLADRLNRPVTGLSASAKNRGEPESRLEFREVLPKESIS